MLNPAIETANILGGKEVLHCQVRSERDLEKSVSDGLPKAALQKLAGHLAVHGAKSDFIYKIIPEATYKRSKRLNIAASEKTERIARLFALSIHIIGNEENAREFFIKKHILLDHKSPFEAALKEIGARRVEEILWKIFYGLPV